MMKKGLALIALLAMAVLTACGSNIGNTEEAAVPAGQADTQKEASSGEQEEEQKIFNLNFGEPFYYERNEMIGTSKVMMTITEHGIVNERYAEDSSKDRLDYLKVYVQVENVGEENSSEDVIDNNSFQAFDANGVEVTGTRGCTMFDICYVDDEFEGKELRPNGKNEGFIYIPLEEGVEPKEIIFTESTVEMLRPYVKQYIFQR